MQTETATPQSPQELAAGLKEVGYLPGASTALVSYLATMLGKPVLVEGPAGVGKTELAKVLASALGTRLVRLQCYEGLDIGSAVYEWNYPRQMIEIRLAEASGSVDRAGLASEAINAARQVGGVIGVAVLGALVAGGGPIVPGLRIGLAVAGAAFLLGAAVTMIIVRHRHS